MFFPSPLSLSSLFSLPSFLPSLSPASKCPPNRAQRFGRAVFSPSRGERHLQPPDTFSRARSRKHYIMALMQQGASALIRQIITFSQHGGDGAKCRRQQTAFRHISCSWTKVKGRQIGSWGDQNSYFRSFGGARSRRIGSL